MPLFNPPPSGGGGGAGMAIGGAISGATTGSVLFANPVLAQDNANFFWDGPNHILKLEGPGQLQVYNIDDHAGNFERGVMDWTSVANVLSIGTPPSSVGGTGVLRDSIYYSAGIPGLYRVANASGDNWFEGGAGNFTVTGYSNFGTGPGALGSVTTGHENMCVGPVTLGLLTTGTQNTVIGSGAGQSMTTGNQNMGIGFHALNALTSGGANIAVGALAMEFQTVGTQNIALGGAALRNGRNVSGCTAIGQFALQNADGCVGNVAIGGSALANLGNTGSNYNVAIGAGAGQWFNTTDAGNVFIGTNAYGNANSGDKNTYIGNEAGWNVTGGNDNLFLGGWRGPSAVVNHIIALSLGNNPVSPWLDNNYTAPNVWSFQQSTTPVGLHVYNTTDSNAPPTNYERVCLDWNLTANVARIAMQAGGTGVQRLVAIDGFAKAGAPVAGDLPSGTFGLINDTSGGATWLCYNSAGTLRKVQLV